MKQTSQTAKPEENTASNLDVELKFRVKKTTASRLDRVVEARGEGYTRSDILRESLLDFLKQASERLKDSGKSDVREAARKIREALKDEEESAND